RAFELLRGLFHLVLILEKSPQPRVRRSRPRISRSRWRSLRIFLEQSFRFLGALLLQNQRNAPVKFLSQVARRHAFPGIRNRQQPLRLAAFHGIVADVVNQLRGFWIALQRRCEFLVRGREIFLLPPAIPFRVMPFSGVYLRQLLDLPYCLVFTATHKTGSAAIEFDQRLPRRKIL